MPDNNEEWRPVRGYEGIYSVSSMGNVRSESRTVPHAVYGKMRVGAKMLRQANHGRGYKMVWLTRDGAKELKLVHRLVVEAFIGPIPDRLQVNHKNGVKHDNVIENLEIVTNRGNSLHAHATGLTKNHGEAHPRAKLTNEDVGEIRAIGSGMRQSALARMFGTDQSSISRILSGKIWKYAQDITCGACREASAASPSS